MKDYSDLQKKMIRLLSEDSRTSITSLATKLHCSRNTIISNLDFLEKDLGLIYTIELNNDKIRPYSQDNIICVKFGVQPKPGELAKLFENDRVARFIAATDGDFGLVLRITRSNTEDYAYWLFALAYKLLPYMPTLMPSTIALRQTGFMPTRSDVISNMDLSNMGIGGMDKEILMLLNDNARMTYAELAKKLGKRSELIRYRTEKLLQSGIIKRFTLTITKPPLDYVCAYFINFNLSEGVFDRYREAYSSFLKMEPGATLVNSSQFVAILSGSHLSFGISCFENESKAIKEIIIANKRTFRSDSPTILLARITEVIKGRLPMRSISIPKESTGIDFRRMQEFLK